MAGGRKSGSTGGIPEQQIGKAQEKVIKAKQAYGNAVDVLQKLLDKREAKRRGELWSAVIKSEKSYDETLKFITQDSMSEKIRKKPHFVHNAQGGAFKV